MTEDGGSYEVSDLFGLRSGTMATEIRPLPSDGDFELAVTADGQPWATYTVSIHNSDGTTVVAIEWVSDRRFLSDDFRNGGLLNGTGTRR